MKGLTIIFLSVISNFVIADDGWRYGVKVDEIRSYYLGSKTCFLSSGVERQVCFESSTNEGKNIVSIVLAAKTTGSPLDINIYEASAGEKVAWFNESQYFLLRHIYSK